MQGGVANGARAWSVAGLLFFFSAVNFADKLVIGLAALPLMKEFGLTPSQFGRIGSSFYLLYAVSGVVVGLFVVRRASPKWLLIALVAIWTAAQVPMMLGGSVAMLFAGRILLGVGEGPATPSGYHALYGWFTSDKRNLPTSVQLAGIGMGFLVGAPVLTAIIQAHGWRAGFAACAILGLVWSAAWVLFGADGPLIARGDDAAGRGDPVRWRAFWTDRTVVASVAVAACAYWMVGLSITWLAPYLQMGLGYTARDTGWLVSAILGAQIPLQLGIAWLSDRLLGAGFGSRVARGVTLGSCMLAAGVAMAAAPSVAVPWLKILLLSLGFTLPSLTFIIGPAIVGEIAPAAQRGTALLVIYSIITLSALASPAVTGWIIEQAGAAPLAGYTQALWLTGAILVLGAVWALLGLNPERTRRRFLPPVERFGDPRPK
jgi:MFS family permease